MLFLGCAMKKKKEVSDDKLLCRLPLQCDSMEFTKTAFCAVVKVLVAF